MALKNEIDSPDVILPNTCWAHSGMTQKTIDVSDKLSLLMWVVGGCSGTVIAVLISVCIYLSGKINDQGVTIERDSVKIGEIAQQVKDHIERSNARLDKLEKWQGDVRDWLDIADKQQATRVQIIKEAKKHWWNK